MIRKVLGLGLCGASLFAVDVCPLPEHNGDVVTHSEFSYIQTQGNTNTSSLGFEGHAKSRWDDHIFRGHADAYRSSSNGVTSKNKWSTELNYDYQFDEVYSTNYMVGYKENRFSGFDYQYYTGPGMGIKVIDVQEHQLDLQGNVLFDKDKPNNKEVERYFSSKLGATYIWKVQDNLKFIQEGTYRVKLNETEYFFLYSKSAIESKINSTVSMGISYKVDYVNTPPVSSASNTDRTFLVSLIVDY